MKQKINTLTTLIISENQRKEARSENNDLQAPPYQKSSSTVDHYMSQCNIHPVPCTGEVAVMFQRRNNCILNVRTNHNPRCKSHKDHWILMLLFFFVLFVAATCSYRLLPPFRPLKNNLNCEVWRSSPYEYTGIKKYSAVLLSRARRPLGKLELKRFVCLVTKV